MGHFDFFSIIQSIFGLKSSGESFYCAKMEIPRAPEHTRAGLAPYGDILIFFRLFFKVFWLKKLRGKLLLRQNANPEGPGAHPGRVCPPKCNNQCQNVNIGKIWETQKWRQKSATEKNNRSLPIYSFALLAV